MHYMDHNTSRVTYVASTPVMAKPLARVHGAALYLLRIQDAWMCDMMRTYTRTDIQTYIRHTYIHTHAGPSTIYTETRYMGVKYKAGA